jgi:hypothetical protein
MQRRQVLALGALSLGSLAGCIGGGSDGAGDSDGVAVTDGNDDRNDGGFGDDGDGGVDDGGDVGGGPPAPRRHSMVVGDVAVTDGALVATFEARPVVESRAAVDAPTLGVAAGERPDPSVAEPTQTPTATNATAANGTATSNGTVANATAANGTSSDAGTDTTDTTVDEAGWDPLATVSDVLTAASPVGVARAGGRGGRGGRGGSDGGGGGLGGSGSGSGGRTGRGGFYPPPGRHHDDDDDDDDVGDDDDAAGGGPEPAARGWNGRPRWDADPEIAEAWYAANGDAVSVYRAGVATAGIASLGVTDVDPPGAGPVPWETVANDPVGEVALSGVEPGWYRVGARLTGPNGHDFGWTAVDALVEDGDGADGVTVGRTWKVSPQL